MEIYNTMTYEDFISNFNINMAIYCVVAVIAIIAMAFPSVRKTVSAYIFIVMFVWLLFLLIMSVTYPESAGIKECKDVIGTVSLQNEYETRTEITSTRYCRYLMNEGWSRWGYENVDD